MTDLDRPDGPDRPSRLERPGPPGPPGGDEQEPAGRLERDLETLSRICREQQAEIRLLRHRLDQLRASRWRRLGQRLGLAMTMPWEKPDRRV